MDADEARWEARQEYAQELAEERAERRRYGCLCLGMDMPGTCPGRDACPLHGEGGADG